MNKFIISSLLFTFWVTVGIAQPLKKQLYNPELNGKVQIADAVKQAKKQDKHVLIQIGGNWCSWCIMFHNFCTQDKEISQYLSDNFVVVKLNYSKENFNKALLRKYRYPNRFGFPVFVILNSKGEYLHTQNSVYLEEGRGYDREKVLDFIKSWSPEALNEENYFKNK